MKIERIKGPVFPLTDGEKEELKEKIIAYIDSVEICDNKVDIFMDDYGQCYYYKKQDNECVGLGTYNSEFIEAILYTFDPYFKELEKKTFSMELTSFDEKALNEYHKAINDYYEELKNR